MSVRSDRTLKPRLAANQIRAIPDQWRPRILVTSGDETWEALPEREPTGVIDRMRHSPWKERWVVKRGGESSQRIGSVLAWGDPAIEFRVWRRQSDAAIPHRQDERGFEWLGHRFLFRKFPAVLECDGASAARFRMRWSSVIVEDFREGLLEPLVLLAVGVTLVGLLDLAS